MANRTKNEYTPDFVSPPGETLQETLETIGMSQSELAERTGRPKKTMNEIIQGKAAITPDTAIQLERVLGVPASFWNKRERNYRENLAQREEQQRLSKQKEWLQALPVKAMVKVGWIGAFKDEVEQIQEVLSFFGVASPQAWEEVWRAKQVAFRKCAAFKSDEGALAAWLRIGEVKAQHIACAPYDAARFRDSMNSIRALTKEPGALQGEAVRICAQAGVALVIVAELPKTHVCGAARWLSPNKALIQLSLRYKRDDQLWFAFFHEAAHILLHSKRDIFLECGEVDDREEREANRFAANTLIPEADLKRFIASGVFSGQRVTRFAQEIDIAPGIVVGRLQREKVISFNQLNELMTKSEVVKAAA